MAEMAGFAIGATRVRIEKVLNDNKAFDEKTAVDLEELGINYERTLQLMEEGGLMGRTSENKIYLTEKARKCKQKWKSFTKQRKQ